MKSVKYELLEKLRQDSTFYIETNVKYPSIDRWVRKKSGEVRRYAFWGPGIVAFNKFQRDNKNP